MMNQNLFSRLRLVGIVGFLLLSGCSLTTPLMTDDHTQTAHDTERARSSEIWLALARAVDARSIDTTTRLAQFVVVLARNGELTSEDAQAFDQSFPHAIHDGRMLTAGDSQSLVELAKRSK